jgi:hypothetical protein
MCRYAIEEQDLEEPESKDDAQPRIEGLGRRRTDLGEMPVEPAPPGKRSIDEPCCERSIRGRQLCALELCAECGVGVGAALLHAS